MNVTESSNAVEILLLVGGITLLPAALFALTGFTRIIIVLGFIRTGLGTPTAPPRGYRMNVGCFCNVAVNIMSTSSSSSFGAMATTFGRHRRYAISNKPW